MTEKQKMLAAMLSGKPTKESEAIRKIAEKAEGSKAPTSYLNEQKYEATLPSASDLNISKQEAINANVKALPSVSEDDLAYFFGDKKGQERPKPKAAVVTTMEEYYKPTPQPQQQRQVINEDEDRFDNIDLAQALKAKRNSTFVDTSQSSTKQIINEGMTSELKTIVENMVYDILAEIIGEANQNLVNKEQIKIMIGESIFVGNIQQALVMPDKK